MSRTSSYIFRIYLHTIIRTYTRTSNACTPSHERARRTRTQHSHIHTRARTRSLASKVLILQKVQQDLLLEAEKKEEEKRSLIDSLVDPLDIEGASEEDLLSTLVKLYQRAWDAEKKRLDKEYQIIKKDFEVVGGAWWG